MDQKPRHPLIAEVATALSREKVEFVVIGAFAMLVRSAGRSTFDVDLLTTDTRVFSLDWAASLPSAASVDSRRGEGDDPFAGVVAFSRRGDMSVDLIVGRWKWQKAIIDRGEPLSVFGLSLPVAARADLVVLKIDAGGPQDLVDAARLLEVGGDELRTEIERILPSLPDALRQDCESFLSA